MLKKLQIIFGILPGLAIIVFLIAVCTNLNKPTPGWLAPVVWSSFGLIAVCCLVVVVTLILELREGEPKDEDELDEEPLSEEAADELAMVGAVSEIQAGEGIHEPVGGGSGLSGGLSGIIGEPIAGESGLGSGFSSGLSGVIDEPTHGADAPTIHFEMEELPDLDE